MIDDLKHYLKMSDRLVRSNGFSLKRTFQSIVLEHGREFAVDENSFAGPRMTPRMCFGNAYACALRDRSLIYVEGFTVVCGVPIDHAWVTRDGITIIDPTIEGDEFSRGPFFGVPIKLDFVRERVRKSKCYGVFNHWNAKDILNSEDVSWVHQFAGEGEIALCK